MGKQVFIGFMLLMLLLFSFLFNKSIIDIRLSEIDYHLNKVALEDQSAKNFNIISRYELIKRRMETGENNAENYTEEGRIQVVLATDTIPQLRAIPRQMHWWHPVRITLAGMRFFLGKEQVGTRRVEQAVEELERAYLYERKRQYEKALLLYDEILAKPVLTPKLHASVLMHKAFCLSLLSNYDESAKAYQEVVDRFGETPEGTLSLRLLDFLNEIQEQKKSVKVSSQNRHEVGKQLYTYMDYKGAIKELDTYLKSAKPKQKRSAHFYKGRAHEELGEFTRAVGEYQSVLKLNGSDDWAQRANRRLVMLGNFYEQKSQSITKARKALVKQGDTAFVKEVEALSNIVEETRKERKAKALALQPASMQKPDSSVQYDSLRITDSLATVDSLNRLDSLAKVDSLRVQDSITRADSLAEVQEKENQREAEAQERKARERERLRREREAVRVREERRLARIEAKQKREEQKKREEELKKQEEERIAAEKQRRKELRDEQVRERKQKLANSEYRNSAYIKKSIEKNIPSFKKLYLKHAQTGEPVAGKIVVEMEISASGSIKAKVVSSTIDNDAFQRDIVKQIESWRFPKVDNELGSMRIRYPFRFKQRVTGQ